MWEEVVHPGVTKDALRAIEPANQRRLALEETNSLTHER